MIVTQCVAARQRSVPVARATRPRPLSYDRPTMCFVRRSALHGRRRDDGVRYDREHKQSTRQRILSAAGRRIKQDGIDGSGVARLMTDAGLTNGAFYAHFDSKEDLVANAVADQLREQLVRLGELGPGRDGVEQFLAWYVSAEHRDAPADGCPSAALLDEIARSSDVVRSAY